MKKNLLFGIFSLLFVFSLHAQTSDSTTSSRLKEIGFSTNIDFDYFDFIYRKQLASNPNQFRRYDYRFSSLSLVGNDVTKIDGDLIFAINAGFRWGKETRQTLAYEKLKFVRGWVYGIDVDISTFSDRYQISPSVGYAFGLQYDFNRKFNIRLETVPTAQLNIASSRTILNVIANPNTSGNLQMVCRF